MLDSLLSDYLPVDRLHVLAKGEDLPESAHGSAMFADISGFTPLTEALARALGPRRGAEELTQQLNLVYDAIIAEVNRFGGSVLGFSGDAITCWFDVSGGEAAHRAVTAALAIQGVMERPTARRWHNRAGVESLDCQRQRAALCGG